MSYPLKFTLRRLGPRTGGTGSTAPHEGRGEDVPVFAYAVINGTTATQSATQYDATLFTTVERLQVIAPPGSFPLHWHDHPAVVETKEGTTTVRWERVDAEENYDNNPFWAPGLSVFYFERETRRN